MEEGREKEASGARCVTESHAASLRAALGFLALEPREPELRLLNRSGKAPSLRRATLIIMVVLGLSGGMSLLAWGAGKVAEKVTDADIRAVITAIEDEIYANGYHTAYIDVGDRVPVYINPRFEKNGRIRVIYKLMPHGEVLRGVVLSPDRRMAMLHKDPKLGFPATDTAAMKTVYLNDDDVIEMKTTWRKVYMNIDLKPAPERIEEAKQREAIRYEGRR